MDIADIAKIGLVATLAGILLIFCVSKAYDNWTSIKAFSRDNPTTTAIFLILLYIAVFGTLLTYFAPPKSVKVGSTTSYVTDRLLSDPATPRSIAEANGFVPSLATSRVVEVVRVAPGQGCMEALGLTLHSCLKLAIDTGRLIVMREQAGDRPVIIQAPVLKVDEVFYRMRDDEGVVWIKISAE